MQSFMGECASVLTRVPLCGTRFYGLVSSGARSTGKIETSVRNPVLSHLDQEVTNNPYRSKKKQLPAIPSK